MHEFCFVCVWWREISEYGSSSNCLDYNYPGVNAFSESESVAIKDFISSIEGFVGIYVTLHSYGQQWVLPWWYTDKQPTDYSELVKRL